MVYIFFRIGEDLSYNITLIEYLLNINLYTF